MFCQQCGKKIDDTAQFCRHCGTPQTPEATDAALRETPNPVPSTAPAGPTPPRQSGKDVRISKKVLIGGVLGLVLVVGAAVIVLGGGINGVFTTSPNHSVGEAGTADLPAQSQSTDESAPAQDGTVPAEAANHQGDGVYTSTDGSWQCDERRMQGYFRDEDISVACTSKSVTYNSGYSGWAISADLSEEFQVQLTLADSVEPQRTYNAADLIGVGKGAPGDLKLYDLRAENTHPVYSVMNPYYTLSTLSNSTEDDAEWCSTFDSALVAVDFVDAERSMLGGTLSFEGFDSNGEPVFFSGCFVAPLPTGSAPASSYSYQSVDTTEGIVPLPENTNPAPCKICYGTGDCVICHGIGYDRNEYDISQIIDCPCNNGRCSACGGTGLDD